MFCKVRDWSTLYPVILFVVEGCFIAKIFRVMVITCGIHQYIGKKVISKCLEHTHMYAAGLTADCKDFVFIAHLSKASIPQLFTLLQDCAYSLYIVSK